MASQELFRRAPYLTDIMPHLDDDNFRKKASSERNKRRKGLRHDFLQLASGLLPELPKDDRNIPADGKHSTDPIAISVKGEVVEVRLVRTVEASKYYRGLGVLPDVQTNISLVVNRPGQTKEVNFFDVEILRDHAYPSNNKTTIRNYFGGVASDEDLENALDLIRKFPKP